MEGVEILSTKVVYETLYHVWPFWILAILVLGGAITTFCISYFHNLNDGFESFLYALVTLCISTILLIIPTVIIAEYKTDNILYVEHKITCSNEVNLNEFYDKYKVIEKEGKIYTVQEYPNK